MSDKEREAFVEWRRSEGYDIDDMLVPLDRALSGQQWKAWQAATERARLAPQAGPVAPNNDEVICPACAHQFRAIPVNVQQLLLSLGAEPPFVHPPSIPAAGWQIERKGDAITVWRAGLGGYAARQSDHQNIASVVLYHLAESLLSAAPKAPSALPPALPDADDPGVPGSV